MTTSVEVMCPKCHGPTWDNRETKKNPKAPDYKCRDKACDGCIWPPKNGARPAAVAAAPAPARESMALGGPMPWEGETDTAFTESVTTARAVVAAPARADVGAEFALYSRCLDQAMKEFLRTGLDKLGGDVAGAVVAATATLFIQANRR